MTGDYDAVLQRIESELTAALPHIAGLSEPCRALLFRGGKRWRPHLLVLSAFLADGTGEAAKIEHAYKLTPLVEFPHTASLIHDDIEDSSDMRRNAPAAHITWGTDTALNAASWLYFQGASCIGASGLTPALQNRLYALYMEEIRNLHLGQALDIAWHKNNAALPLPNEYLTMVRLKTGALVSLAVQTGLYAGGADEKIAGYAGKIALEVGAAFQIIDDVTNLTAGNPGKKRGDDIVEGKKSYPMLLHIEQNPNDFPRIASYFERAKREGVDSPAVEACIALLDKSGAITKAAEEARAGVKKACGEFKELYPGREKLSGPIIQLFRQLCGI
jgi:octaprenyl-diphosphate synthase